MASITFWLVMMGFIIGVSATIISELLRRKYVKWRFPISVPIIIQRGKSNVWDLTERAREQTRKDGTEALQLMKRRKETLKPPKYNTVSTDRKGKAVYPIYNTIKGQYFPVKLVEEGVSFDVVEDKSSKNWAVGEMSRVISDYAPKEGWLAKYGVFIMNATFAAMVIFFVIYFSGKIEISSNALAGGASRMADAVEKLTASMS